MTAAPLRRLWLLTGVLALAFVLRAADLGAVPLRGDEAFAVRYWADDPARSLPLLTDLGEPHPLGTYLAFWAWKSLAGDSEVAMRTLPLLGSLLGVAATAALARHLFRHGDRRLRDGVTLLAALLWAINAFQIWHAQDARNYALWAGLSALAMLCFVRLVDAPPGRRTTGLWLAYILAQTLALHAFFLEVFMLVVQAFYLLIVHPHRPLLRRITLLRTVSAWSMVALLALPLIWQARRIMQVGYNGTTEPANALRLLTRFLPTLLAGPESSTWPLLLALGWLLLFVAALVARLRARTLDRLVIWLALWVIIPVLMLWVAATRSNVFHPRYVIVVACPLLILLAALLVDLTRQAWPRLPVMLVMLGLLAAPAASLANLIPYYRHTDPKAPDWPSLVAYLEDRTPPAGPALVLQTLPDPAFAYYYTRAGGHAAEKTLVMGQPIQGQLFSDTLYFRSIWLLGRYPHAEAFLANRMQRVSQHTLPDFTVTQYRPWIPQPAEFDTAIDSTFGDIARLQGVTVQGPDATSRAITVLLYWQPLGQTATPYKVFVHLLGPVNPATGSPLWAQDDDQPLDGFAPTTDWAPDALLRDPYALLDDPAAQQALIPGTYQIAVGLYDPATNTRLPVTDSSGQPLGDSTIVASFTLP